MCSGWVCQASCPVSGLGFIARGPSSTFYFLPAAPNSRVLGHRCALACSTSSTLSVLPPQGQVCVHLPLLVRVCGTT